MNPQVLAEYVIDGGEEAGDDYIAMVRGARVVRTWHPDRESNPTLAELIRVAEEHEATR